MREFLKRLFGRSAGATQAPGALVPPARRSRSLSEHDAPPDQVPMASKHTGDAVVHRYFALINTVLRAKADSDFSRAIRAARDTYPLMPAVVRQIKKEYGEFDIGPSAAVHTASTLMAVMGDREGIQELREALAATRELKDWLPSVERAETDADLVDKIVAAVAARPGLSQSELKNCVGSDDGRRLSTLATWLEKGNRPDPIQWTV